LTPPAEQHDRQRLAAARRWVVKVGSALLTNDGAGLDPSIVQQLADQLAALRARGCDVVLVSSGAIVAGLARLHLTERPHEVHLSQAAAAVGQSALVRAYEESLDPHGVTTAQILLSHADVRARDRYLNARSTLSTLLGMKVLPIVNENDTVVTDEIRLGDNDTLAALVANLVDADALLILTDQDGLMDLLILTAQQHQELLLFTQQVDGDFERSVLIKQGAGYGYNGFELVDWNQDERVDLLMVNGNNMEIRNAPIKNYHGIRILQQTQERTFEEALFYPFPGAIKALATDFDQDGDLDVAAIAFYPDWSQEHPLTFVYLEQKEGTLTASTTALKDWGRWMTMDAGDFNQDGYPDLILGGAYVKHGVHDLHQAHYQSLPHPSILMLDNVGAR